MNDDKGTNNRMAGIGIKSLKKLGIFSNTKTGQSFVIPIL